MPTYDYHCTECKHAFETKQKITEEPLTQCPECKRNSLRRGPGGGIGLQFKGSGFYLTDYCGTAQPEGSCACGQKSANECTSSS